jgi:hypothetical protein
MAATGLGVYSASNRNEYQKHKNKNVSGSKVRWVRRADNLTAICDPIVLDNVGFLTSHNPIGLQGLLQGQLYFLLYDLYNKECLNSLGNSQTYA